MREVAESSGSTFTCRTARRAWFVCPVARVMRLFTNARERSIIVLFLGREKHLHHGEKTPAPSPIFMITRQVRKSIENTDCKFAGELPRLKLPSDRTSNLCFAMHRAPRRDGFRLAVRERLEVLSTGTTDLFGKLSFNAYGRLFPECAEAGSRERVQDIITKS